MAKKSILEVSFLHFNNLISMMLTLSKILKLANLCLACFYSFSQALSSQDTCCSQSTWSMSYSFNIRLSIAENRNPSWRAFYHGIMRVTWIKGEETFNSKDWMGPSPFAIIHSTCSIGCYLWLMVYEGRICVYLVHPFITNPSYNIWPTDWSTKEYQVSEAT